MDYYGKRLATCSSDKTIRIFNVVKGEAKGDPIILKGWVSKRLTNERLADEMVDTRRLCGSSHGLILHSDQSWRHVRMMVVCLSGKRSDRANLQEVGVRYKMDGRGSRSTPYILLVVRDNTLVKARLDYAYTHL